jgi:cobalt-zinc-cadmium efflux system outer membrane protein
MTLTTGVRGAALAVSIAATTPAIAGGPLTLDEALRIARERAPAALAAGLRVKEAEGRLRAAGVLRDNPALEALVEPFPDEGDEAEFDVAIDQEFEAPGRRRARRDAAEAALAGAEAERREALRIVLADVEAAFFRALHARDRQGLAETTRDLDAELLRAVEARHAAGDVAILEVNLARSSLARSSSGAMAAAAEHQAALAGLRRLLGLAAPEPIQVAGDLARDGQLDLAAVPPSAGARPDLAALRARRDEAEADLAGARALRRPEWGLGALYKREEGAEHLLAGGRFTLPVANRGAGEIAEATARRDRLALAAEAGGRAAEIDLRAAVDAYRLRREAAEALATLALPLLDDNQDLALKSYEAGQIGLPDYLLVRRDRFETRALHLDRLLDAALAKVAVEAAAGLLP